MRFFRNANIVSRPGTTDLVEDENLLTSRKATELAQQPQHRIQSIHTDIERRVLRKMDIRIVGLVTPL